MSKASHVWEAPPAGTLKLNVDASVFSGASSFSLGLVIRDDIGMFIRGRTVCVASATSVFEAETYGVLEALSWIASDFHQPVIV